MSGPSEHLSWAELACKDGTPYPAMWRQSRAPKLAAAFEVVRAAVGKPIRIGSGYRTPSHNAKVGGARASQHVEGRALDLYPPNGMTVAKLYRLVRDVAKAYGIRGLGLYPTFVHMDIRPSEKLIVWHGNRAWAELT